MDVRIRTRTGASVGRHTNGRTHTRFFDTQSSRPLRPTRLTIPKIVRNRKLIELAERESLYNCLYNVLANPTCRSMPADE